MMSFTQADRYAVVGHPIAHSKSPQIHALFAEQTGQCIQYERLLAPVGGFAQTVRAFFAAGGQGLNVTVPFKFEAFALAHSASPRARIAQAANTLALTPQGHITADNTDGPGMVWDIERQSGPLSGKRVMVVGAGGAVAGVLGALAQAGVQGITLLNRSPDKAHALLHTLKQALEQGLLAGAFASLAAHLYGGGLDAQARSVDVLINGTSAALHGQSFELAPQWLDGVQLAYDMMYAKEPTPFMRWAHAEGVPASDGLGMLVGQAAVAFEVWRGVHPDPAPVLQVLRAQWGVA